MSSGGTAAIRLKIGLAIARLGSEIFARRRGHRLAWHLEMFAHGVIGNGWDAFFDREDWRRGR